MELRRLAGLALGLALPLTIALPASADWDYNTVRDNLGIGSYSDHKDGTGVGSHGDYKDSIVVAVPRDDDDDEDDGPSYDDWSGYDDEVRDAYSEIYDHYYNAPITLPGFFADDEE